MTTLEYFGIYGKEIEQFTAYCDEAMEQMNFTDAEIDSVYERVTDTFEDLMQSGHVKLNNFSVKLMTCIAQETVAALEERFPNEEFDYEIENAVNAHLLVNGGQLKRSVQITELLNGYYTDEPMEFTRDEIGVSSAKLTSRGDGLPSYVECTLYASEYLANEMLMRTNIENIEARLKADENMSISVYVHRYNREEDNTKMFAVIKDVSSGKITDTAEIPLTAEEIDGIKRITQEAFEKIIKREKELNFKEIQFLGEPDTDSDEAVRYFLELSEANIAALLSRTDLDQNTINEIAHDEDTVVVYYRNYDKNSDPPIAIMNGNKWLRDINLTANEETFFNDKTQNSFARACYERKELTFDPNNTEWLESLRPSDKPEWMVLLSNEDMCISLVRGGVSDENINQIIEDDECYVHGYVIRSKNDVMLALEVGDVDNKPYLGDVCDLGNNNKPYLGIEPFNVPLNAHEKGILLAATQEEYEKNWAKADEALKRYEKITNKSVGRD